MHVITFPSIAAFFDAGFPAPQHDQHVQARAAIIRIFGSVERAAEMQRKANDRRAALEAIGGPLASGMRRYRVWDTDGFRYLQAPDAQTALHRASAAAENVEVQTVMHGWQPIIQEYIHTGGVKLFG